MYTFTSADSKSILGNNIKLNLVLVIALANLWLGCATTPKKYVAEKTKGQWEAKLQISDLKLNKNYILDLDVIAAKPGQLRAEVTGSLGVAVASVVLKEKSISYAVHRTKRFYTGLTGDSALAPVLQVSFDPALLMNIFFDDPIRMAGWNCISSPENIIESCVRDGDKLFVQWQERTGENKRVLIRAQNFEIQVVVKNFIPEPKALDKAFLLLMPANYRLQKLD